MADEDVEEVQEDPAEEAVESPEEEAAEEAQEPEESPEEAKEPVGFSSVQQSDGSVVLVPVFEGEGFRATQDKVK